MKTKYITNYVTPPPIEKKRFQRNGGGALKMHFRLEIYTLIWSCVRLQTEKWMPSACGYWEFISFLRIKLWVALIQLSHKTPEPRDPEPPYIKGAKKNL